MRQAWSRNIKAKGIRRPRKRCEACGKCAKKVKGISTNGYYICKTEGCARHKMTVAVAQDDRFY